MRLQSMHTCAGLLHLSSLGYLHPKRWVFNL